MEDTHVTDPSGKPRFSLAALLVSLVVIGLVLGWWVDRTRIQRELTRTTEIARLANLNLFERLRGTAIGMPASGFPELQKFANYTFDDSKGSGLWDHLAPNHKGKTCVGYYFQTAEFEEGSPGFYVLVVNGDIVAVERQQLEW